MSESGGTYCVEIGAAGSRSSLPFTLRLKIHAFPDEWIKLIRSTFAKAVDFVAQLRTLSTAADF